MNQTSHNDLGVIQVLQPTSLPQLQKILTTIDERINTLEWRLDALEAEAWEDSSVIADLIASCSQQIIITLRPQREGGHFVGSESQRLQYLKQLASYSPAWVDIEHDVPLLWLQRQIKDFPKIRWIRSRHIADDNVVSLQQSYHSMQCAGVQLYKLVIAPTSPLEGLILLRWLQFKTDVIAHAMGAGLSFTRVMARISGSKGYYCSQEGDSCLGLLPVQTSLDQYRVHRLNRQTKVFALLGYEVSHSLGPLFHNDYFAKNHFNAVYVAIPLDEEALMDCITALHELGVQGMSLTRPFKQQAIKHELVKVDASIASLQAVNTLVYHSSGYCAFNTDQIGIQLGAKSLQDRHACLGHVAILGLGGLGCMVCEVLSHLPTQSVQLWNRSVDKKHDALKQYPEFSSLDCMPDVDLWISTLPQESLLQWVQASVKQMKPGCTVWNMNYNQDDRAIKDCLEVLDGFYLDGQQLFYDQARVQQTIWQTSLRASSD